VSAERASSSRRPPAGLKVAGKALWKAILEDVADGYELDRRELELLAHACSTVDTIAALEATVGKEGLTVPGSRGQTTTHPALSEVRAQRVVLARLLRAIELPEPDESPVQHRARHAATARYARRKRTQNLREVK
jgi:phage terminase small subunit